MLWEGIMHTGGIWKVVLGNCSQACTHAAPGNAHVGSESGCVTGFGGARLVFGRESWDSLWHKC